MPVAALRPLAATALVAALSGMTPLGIAPAASSARPVMTSGHVIPEGTCSPSTSVLGYSDALDKLRAYGTQVSGLSSLAWDRRSRSYVAGLDNNKSDPSRLWFFTDLRNPSLTRAPLVLRMPDGTPYTGLTADNEGLAVTRSGDYLVSSETEPSIRVFGRDGIQRSSLPVPSRFRVSPDGEATANATLEGLSLSADKRRLVAAMEGPLSGDGPAAGTPTDVRRLLTYRESRRGWKAGPQLGYAVDPGMRIAEVQEYAPGALLVLEASWSAARGNDLRLYAVTGIDRARDVTQVANLSTRPDLIMTKRLVADLVNCPTLGAKSNGRQRNPLLDNDEGMVVTPVRHHGHRRYRISLISDDNNSVAQRTRVVNLLARLP